MIRFVYAQDENGGIGYQNELPWHLPNDFKFFKETTMGHTLLMGRKTFESMNRRLLPGRKTVVLTTNPNYCQEIEDLTVVTSKEEALALAEETDLMIVGGAGVFLSFFDEVDEITRTVIHASFKHDVAMPQIDETQFELVKQQHVEADAENPYPHTFEWWRRK